MKIPGIEIWLCHSNIMNENSWFVLYRVKQQVGLIYQGYEEICKKKKKNFFWLILIIFSRLRCLFYFILLINVKASKNDHFTSINKHKTYLWSGTPSILSFLFDNSCKYFNIFLYFPNSLPNQIDETMLSYKNIFHVCICVEVLCLTCESIWSTSRHGVLHF